MIISKQTRAMLLAESTFAEYASQAVADATTSTEPILVLGVENRADVDELVGKALAAGASPVGGAR